MIADVDMFWNLVASTIWSWVVFGWLIYFWFVRVSIPKFCSFWDLLNTWKDWFKPVSNNATEILTSEAFMQECINMEDCGRCSRKGPSKNNTSEFLWKQVFIAARYKELFRCSEFGSRKMNEVWFHALAWDWCNGFEGDCRMDGVLLESQSLQKWEESNGARDGTGLLQFCRGNTISSTKYWAFKR